MKTNGILSAVMVCALLLLAACTAGHNGQVETANAEGIVAGFWRGLWHGVIAPVTFVVSLFRADVQVYEVHNNGAWYNFGFVLGMMMLHGHAANRTRRHPARRQTPAGA
jgi:hypothetical protein